MGQMKNTKKKNAVQKDKERRKRNIAQEDGRQRKRNIPQEERKKRKREIPQEERERRRMRAQEERARKEKEKAQEERARKERERARAEQERKERERREREKAQEERERIANEIAREDKERRKRIQRNIEKRRKKKRRQEQMANSPFRELLNWLLYFLLIIGITYLIITYVGQRTRVSGSSMETTLHDGDNLIVDKISYRFREPERYEIIVFPFQHKENTFYIKRIIGMPGETVQVKDGYVFIDGEQLDEHYGNELMELPGIAEEPITLGEDEYFVLGDNRNHSSDSRDPSVGILHRKDLLGRAWIRIWPMNNFGVIKHE